MKKLRILLLLISLTTASIRSSSDFTLVLAEKIDAIVAPIIGLVAGASYFFGTSFFDPAKISNFDIFKSERTQYALGVAAVTSLVSWGVLRLFTVNAYYRSAEKLFENNKGIFSDTQFATFDTFQDALAKGNSKEKSLINSTERVAHAAAKLVETLNIFSKALEYLEKAVKKVVPQSIFFIKIENLREKINKAYAITQYNLVVCQQDARYAEEVDRYASKENTKILGQTIGSALTAARINAGVQYSVNRTSIN